MNAKKPAGKAATARPRKLKSAPARPPKLHTAAASAAKAAKPDTFRDYVVAQLSAVQGVVARGMFGGYGLFRDKAFFGVIHQGRLYFKTDAQSEVAYRERGMDYFHPGPRMYLKHHFEVPPDVLEDAEQLAVWARRALAAKPEDKR